MAIFGFEPESEAQTISDITYLEGPRRQPQVYLILNSRPAMVGLCRYLEPYFSSGLKLDHSQVLLKTRKALVSPGLDCPAGRQIRFVTMLADFWEF